VTRVWSFLVYTVLMTAIERICASLSRAGVRYAVVGGHSVASHGAVRETVDVDLAIAWNLKTLVAAEKALNEVGLVSRLPVTADDIFNIRKEHIENRNRIAWNFYNPNDLSEQVDIRLLDDFRRVNGNTRSESRLIGMKVPVDLLAAFKANARLCNVPYQTQIKKLMIAWLKESN